MSVEFILAKAKVSYNEEGSIKLDIEQFKRNLQISGIKYWKGISTLYIERYIESFFLFEKNLFSTEEKQDVNETIQLLIQSQEYVRAAKYIHSFGLNEEHDCRKLASQLISRDSAELAVKLVSALENKTALSEIIGKLDYFKYNNLASAAIKSNKLNHQDFPKLISHQLNGALRSFVKRHCWEKTEEVALQRLEFYGNTKALDVLVKILIKNKQFDEAYSVSQRNSQFISDYVIKDLKSMAKSKNKLENKLFTQDIFGPTEVAMYNEKEEEYLRLSDFGVEEKDVLFLADDSADEFTNACEHLLSSSMVKSLF